MAIQSAKKAEPYKHLEKIKVIYLILPALPVTCLFICTHMLTSLCKRCQHFLINNYYQSFNIHTRKATSYSRHSE